MVESLKGKLLLAAPSLRDPNFVRTAVLMCEHGAEGALGLVVNRRSEITMGQALAHIPGAKGRDESLWQGGPVQPESVFILHDRSGSGGTEVAPGLWFGGGIEILTSLLAQEDAPGRFRLYAGYAGWGAGQLEFELSQQSWIICPARPEIVFWNGGALGCWGEALKGMGGRYAIMAQTPIDPEWN